MSHPSILHPCFLAYGGTFGRPIPILTRLTFAATLAIAWALATPAAATHSPAASVCYDCHAVSKGKMVTGTHLIRASQKTADLHQGADVARCTACPPHSNEFAASCTGCHGNTAAGSWWPDGAAYPNRKGGHQTHIDAIASRQGWTTATQKNASCTWCHPGVPPAGHPTGSGQAVVNGDGSNTAHFKTIAGAVNGLTIDAYDPTAKACANVDCHYRATTPSSGAAPTVGWLNAADTVDCSGCHYYRDAATYTSPMKFGAGVGQLPDAHAAHVAGVPPPSDRQSKSYACSVCHPVAGYTAAHLDGLVQVSTAGVPVRDATEKITKPDGVTAIDATVKFGAGTAASTCTNFYCHGARFTVAARAPTRRPSGTCTPRPTAAPATPWTPVPSVPTATSSPRAPTSSTWGDREDPR